MSLLPSWADPPGTCRRSCRLLPPRDPNHRLGAAPRQGRTASSDRGGSPPARCDGTLTGLRSLPRTPLRPLPQVSGWAPNHYSMHRGAHSRDGLVRGRGSRAVQSRSGPHSAARRTEAERNGIERFHLSTRRSATLSSHSSEYTPRSCSPFVRHWCGRRRAWHSSPASRGRSQRLARTPWRRDC